MDSLGSDHYRCIEDTEYFLSTYNVPNACFYIYICWIGSAFDSMSWMVVIQTTVTVLRIAIPVPYRGPQQKLWL